MSEEREHALLSASSAHKWLVCTPSARLEEEFENVTSEYMEEGTLAHSFCELKLQGYFTDMTKRKYNAELKKLKADVNFKPEMDSYSDDYLDYVKEIALATKAKAFVGIEEKIDYRQYARDGFGTADCLIIADTTITIIDFKYGKGVEVSAEQNPQMMLYALGAIEKYKILYNITRVKMVIFQPRIGNISEYEMPAGELLAWGEMVVKPKAELAYAGIGGFEPGEHCRFCKAKARCKARAKEFMGVVEEIKANPNLVSNLEIGQMLVKAEGIDKWIKDLQSEALNTILKGEEIPGWKVVEGKSNRIITDIDGAFKKLSENGYNEALLYERKPLGITALEQLVTKKKFIELIGEFIEKPKGSPTLAKESDKRENYRFSTAAEDFAEKIKESEEN